MSDAFTDIARDENLRQKDSRINLLEAKFLEEPSPELAKKIVDELNTIKNMPRGYFMGLSKEKIENTIKNYQEYLEDY